MLASFATRRGFMSRVAAVLFFLISSIQLCSIARADLRADELLLIVNKNMPEGLKLAKFYSEQRQVPDGRIVELDLPADEQMTFDAYERTVVPSVREFLRKAKLDRQVRCLVTFYGVPLRIAARTNTVDDTRDLKFIQFDQAEVMKNLTAAVGEMETLAKSVDVSFAPIPGVTLEQLGQRLQAAVKTLQQKDLALTDNAAKTKLDDQFRAVLVKLVGPAQLPYKPAAAEKQTDAVQAEQKRRDALVALSREVDALAEQRYDRDARTKLRKLVRDKLGLFASAKLIASQVDYFQTSSAASPVPQTTAAALDSELSFLWIPTYARLGWQLNPLHYAAPPGPKPPILMVMRLDAASPEVVKTMIEDSILAEKTGLTGTFAIDARGLMLGKTTEGPAIVDYDKKTRDLADLAKSKGTLPVTFDDTPALLPANGINDVALYTGWYSVHNYVAPGKFVTGAVGYHTASFELLSLRTPNETGWVRGLTSAGVVASVGPVAEPYLHAFPRPDDFFPLLMTGRLTLAETYWKTNPLCSWMMAAIGDPLYKPFGVKPALKSEDLPDRLKPAIETPK